MYASFFGLRELPFNNTPDPRYFYSTPDHEEALASLIYAVQERKGFVLLTGEIGAGKTLVSRMMLQHFETRIAFATINHALGSSGDLLESICTEFELPFEAQATHTQLVRTLHDFLLAKFAHDVPVVLVLDEAQTLPIDAFEQVRMIGNLEADDAKLLQVAIFGQPELQRMFATPALRQLRQRIFRSYHLPALSPEETEGYIRHRLSVAGAHRPSIFDAEAIARIYDHSRGLPRIINTLCDNALLSAYSLGERSIRGAFIESVVQQMMAFGDTRPGRFDCGKGAPACATSQAVCMSHPSGPSRDDPASRHHTPGQLFAGHGRQPPGDQNYFQESFAAPSSSANAHEPVYAHRALEAMRDEIVLLGRDLRSRVEVVNRRLATVEGRLAYNHERVSEARTAHDRLKPLFAQVECLVKQSKTDIAELAQSEGHMRELALKMKRVIDGVRPIFVGLKRAAADTQRAERAGHKVCNRLVAQTERARRIAGKLDHVANRLARDAAVREAHPFKIIKEASKPVVSRGRLLTVVSRDAPLQDRFREMLDNSRKSLSDLRTFVRGDHGTRGRMSSLNCHASTVPDLLVEEPAMRRMVSEVDTLLEMVEAPKEFVLPA